MAKKNLPRNCYCKERKNNRVLAKSMKNIPSGFCGICDICGKPGHTNAHPHLPTTGAWCDKCWKEINSHMDINISQLLFSLVILIVALVFLYVLRNIVAEFPLYFFSIVYS